MANSRMNVSIGFSADVTKIKQQLKDLKNDLNGLTSNTVGKKGLMIDDSLRESIRMVNDLKAKLEAATNVDTGKLDLGKFNTSLKNSGKEISDYTVHLKRFGAEGEQVFNQLSSSILNAETSSKELVGWMGKLKTTFANTVRWQISSTALNALMGSVQGAYRYAQDLNESLNNIRIVTGQSTEQMAKFAKEANKAARALSTTTVEYTDAALIYYQQGLSDKQVKEYTDVTVKMANVSRQSAAEVSDQLTAVWNNFNKAGEHSAEYFADIMVKLGAETASSSEEIAGGLEKFAAIADTVGLSFEYAASALATITATTRQSEDVVGTALRTIFARIEGLSLGETLEDGVTLNKYSEALASVGINILDQNNNLKEMDTILNDIGSKWNTLSEAQQTALAQTVGGTRQYAQLIALFDNWDFFQENLNTAYNSTGALDEQQQIYAESWEAAADRVTAAAERIWNALLKDDFFIGLLNITEKVINGIGGIVDALGGLKGVLGVIGVLATRIFAKEISKGFSDTVTNFKKIARIEEKENRVLVKKMAKEQRENLNSDNSIYDDFIKSRMGEWTESDLEKASNPENYSDHYNSVKADSVKDSQRIRDLVVKNKDNLSDEKLISLSGELQLLEQLMQKSEESAKALDKTLAKIKQLEDALKNGDVFTSNDNYAKLENITNKKRMPEKEKAKNILSEMGYDYDEIKTNLKETKGKSRITIKEILEEALKQMKEKIKAEAEEEIKKFEEEEKQQHDQFDVDVENADSMAKNIKTSITENSLKTLGDRAAEVAINFTTAYSAVSGVENVLKVVGDESLSASQKLSSLSASAIQAIFSLKTVWNSENAAAAKEGKTGISSVISGLIGGFGSLQFWILAATAAFKVLGFVWEKIKENSLEEKIERAKEATQAAAEAAQEATNKYNELNDTLENLTNVEETLSKLVKGTNEWTAAILQANNEALELIKTYDLIAGQDYYFDENGRIIFTKTGTENMNAQAADNQIKALSLQRAAMAEQVALEAQQAKSENNKIFYAYDLNNPNGGGEVSTSYLLGLRNELGENYNEDNIKEKLNELYQGTLSEATLDSLAFQAVSPEATEAMNKLASALDAANAPMEALARTSVSQVVGENFAQEGDIFQEAVTAAAAEEYQKIIENKDEVDKFFQEALAQEGITETQVYNDYAEARDLTYDASKKKFFNADGTENTAINRDLIKTAYANPLIAQQAVENVTSNDEILAETLSAYSVGSYQADNQRETTRATSLESELDTETLNTYQKALKENNEYLAENDEMIHRITVANMAMNKGYEDLLDNFDEYNEALKHPGTQDYYTTLQKLKDDMSLIVDFDASGLSEEWLTSKDNLNLMREAVNGNIEALDELRLSATREYVVGLAIDEEQKNQVLNLLTEEVMNHDLTIGMSLDSDQALNSFVDTMNKMIEDGILTANQVSDILNGINFEPDLDYAAVEWSTNVAQRNDVMVEDGKGGYRKAVGSELSESYEGTLYLPLINASKTTYKGPAKSTVSSANRTKAAGNKKDNKKIEDESERYHVIKEQLEDITNELNRIDKAKGRAFGGDKLALMDEEIARTEQLIEGQKEYLRQIEANYNKDRSAIAAYGAQFDENGVITNYDDLIAAQVNRYNASKSDEAEEAFENFKKVLDQYEETSDLVAEERQNLIDKENELYDLLLEKLQYEIELKIEIDDDDLKYLDFLLKQVGDSAYETADAIALLAQKTGETMSKVDTYTEGINKLFQNHGFVGDITELLGDNSTDLLKLAEAYTFTEAEVDTLREYRDGLMDTTEQLMDLQQEIRDKVIPAFEDLTAEMDKEADKLNHLSSMLEHYKNIVDIVGKDTLGISDELLASLDTAKVDNAINQLEASYAKLSGMRESRAEVEKQLEDARAASNEDLIEYWEDTLAEIDEQIRDAEDEHMTTWENALKAAADAYDAAVERSIARFEKAMSGTYGNFEALQDAYDKQQKVDERYLADYEKIYELNKLNRDISNSIDDTDNIKGKQMLIELQKEINALDASGVEMSKYQVDFLRQKYELRLAEIALEEAQNAKNQVRMTRDSEGNWSYTYTADAENIANAQQNYEDKLFQIQELTSNYITEMEGQIIDAMTQMSQELAGIEAGDVEARNRVVEHWTSQITYLQEQMQGALDNNKAIYEDDWTSYHESTGYKLSDLSEYLTTFEDTNLSIMTGYDTLGEFQAAFTEASGTLYDELGEATEIWQQRTEAAMQAAGTSVEGFKETMDVAVEDIKEQSNSAADSVQDMGSKMVNTFNTTLAAVDNFETQYGKLIESTIKNNGQIIESCNQVVKAWANVNAAQNGGPFNTINPTTGQISDVSADGYKGGNGPDDPVVPTGPGEDIIGYDVIDKRTGKLISRFSNSVDARKFIINAGAKGGEYEIKFRFGNGPVALDTGGYTGSWNSTNGKLALLHEKELVLNKQDTKNILDSVEIVRSLSQWLDMRAQIMRTATVGATGIKEWDNTLQQMVTIEANFPNANNREEIKAAFADLTNRAVQFANRKG